MFLILSKVSYCLIANKYYQVSTKVSSRYRTNYCQHISQPIPQRETRLIGQRTGSPHEFRHNSSLAYLVLKSSNISCYEVDISGDVQSEMLTSLSRSLQNPEELSWISFYFRGVFRQFCLLALTLTKGQDVGSLT